MFMSGLGAIGAFGGQLIGYKPLEDAHCNEYRAVEVSESVVHA